MTSYNQLKKEYDEMPIPYSELLRTDEWEKCRKRTLDSHNNTCNGCSAKLEDKFTPIPDEIASSLRDRLSKEEKMLHERILSIGRANGIATKYNISSRIKFPIEFHKFHNLDIHHMYYILSKLPWEYPEALIPLCRECHLAEHQTNNIKVFENSIEDNFFEIAQNCGRCEGTGTLEEFFYYKNGICFNCSGKGYINFKQYNGNK